MYVDGKRIGEIHFPAGEVELTAACQAGSKHLLSLHVTALPLKGVLLSYTDSNSAREVQGSVERRGLCGDVYLTSTPTGARINDVKIDTSVERGEITVDAALENLAADAKYALRVRISKGGHTEHEFTSGAFTAADLKRGRFTIAEKWMPEVLWDTNTPQNQFQINVSLVDASDGDTKVLDAAHSIRTGFREFRIDGRDFVLNGKRIYLSAVPLDNAQIGARSATYEGALETMKRLQSFGINFVYTHNYGCEPGSHVSFEEILRAADDAGMLVALSQPHFAHYDWDARDADRTNGYARHAEFYVRVAQNHPSVVAYSMSHNATGYDEDMNPDLIDGVYDARKESWSRNNANRALKAEKIVKAIDPGRIVYHHESGNLGSMHTANFYVNFVPIQEMSEWFGHWATKGVKPLFLVEYGVPFTWDWTMYRGWYKGQREWGSAAVPWEFCLAEWNAQFLGDRAYRITNGEARNLRYEAEQFRAGRLWHRWDYPQTVGSGKFQQRQKILAEYVTDNWRAFRTWGVSANSPWEYAEFWVQSDKAQTRKEFAVDWDNLQRPGFSPDYSDRRQGWMANDLERSDWVATAPAEALVRNNGPLLAYIAGKPESFTSKDHIFTPGETVQKQLIVINNSRVEVSCECEWTLGVPAPISGDKRITLATGQQERIPLRFDLPRDLGAGAYQLSATFRFDNGETQNDTFTIDVMPRRAALKEGAKRDGAKIALWDPAGESRALLDRLGIAATAVDVDADLSPYDVLIIGKNAFTPDGAGPDVARVRDGLKVVVFEQSAKVLEGRFGFRVAEYGLRKVFQRVPDQPALSGITEELLRDWRGEATLLPPRLEYTLRPRYGPTVKWCGIDVPRVWRCGCRGNVASVLIEKPACGDFLAILDGGFSLQYSPLLEYHEGRGIVLFCQLDVSGRSESDPAADAIAANIIGYALSRKVAEPREAAYVGDDAGKKHLEAAGFALADYDRDALTPESVLIVGPGGGKKLAGDADAIRRWLNSGGHLLAIGFDGADADALFGSLVRMKSGEHIAEFFEPAGANSLLTGVGPADVHNRDPREIPLVGGGTAVIGGGVLARLDGANVVFCQLAPWQFDSSAPMNQKRTFRRTAHLVARLASNMGAKSTTPVLARFASPVADAQQEQRWLDGLYLDVPEEWDDPYRYFRW